MTFMRCPRCGVSYVDNGVTLDCDLVELLQRCPYMQALPDDQRVNPNECPALVAAVTMNRTRRDKSNIVGCK